MIHQSSLLRSPYLINREIANNYSSVSACAVWAGLNNPDLAFAILEIEEAITIQTPLSLPIKYDILALPRFSRR